jgi:hypothetical protein
MRRFAHLVFTIIAPLSLLLFLMSVVVWMGSYSTQRLLTIPVTQSKTVHVFWARGSVGFTLPKSFDYRVIGRLSFNESQKPADLYRYWGTLRSVRFHALGFALTVGNGGEAPGVLLPCWFLALTFLTLPALWIWWRLTRITPTGVCAACGYDLRATPDRCPECGAVNHAIRPAS